MPKPQPRRIDYPDQAAFPDCYVVLPPRWTGEHLERAAAASLATARFKSQAVANACIALVLADEFHLPGLDGTDPIAWDLTATPYELLIWLSRVVYEDYARGFNIPKALPSPSSQLLTAKTVTDTGGDSGTTA